MLLRRAGLSAIAGLSYCYCYCYCCCYCCCYCYSCYYYYLFGTVSWRQGGTAAAAPPPFRPSDPALCGSCPLVTPYYCRLGDLMCYSCLLYLSYFVCACICVICVFFVFFCVIFLYNFFLQYFDTVGWVF